MAEERHQQLPKATRQHRYTQELGKSLEMEEDILEVIMENTGAHLAYLDPDFNFVKVNSACAKGSGHTTDELIGQNHFALFPNEENQAIFEKVRDTGKSVEFNDKPFEYIDQPWRGITYWDWTLVPVKDASGHVQGLVLSLVDTTERKRAEEELRSSRDYLERLTNSMWDAVFSVQMPERVIEWVNDSFRLIGYEPEECIGKTTQFLYPDEKEFFTFGDKLESAIAEGKDVLDTEQLLKRKNGEVFPAEITTTFFKEKGKVVRVTSIVRDVTEHKRAEEKIQSLAKFPSENPNPVLRIAKDGTVLYANKASLPLLDVWRCQVGQLLPDYWRKFILDALGSRSSKNAEAECRDCTLSLTFAPVVDAEYVNLYGLDITERKKLDQLKDDFIGLVSHELRSPLTVITGAVHTVLTEREHLSPEETHQLLTDANLEADSLSHLLGNLVELSRVQADRLFLHAEVIRVRKVIQGTIEEVKRQSSAHQFIVDVPRKLPPVHADQLRLERILYNLIENAVKYSPEGGEIRVSVKPEGEHLVIGVSDQGIGISLSDQAKLFGPFQRVEESRLDDVGGLGLGLLVCRRLVEAHGGRIWVESEPGCSSTFFFTLPLNKR